MNGHDPYGMKAFMPSYDGQWVPVTGPGGAPISEEQQRHVGALIATKQKDFDLLVNAHGDVAFALQALHGVQPELTKKAIDLNVHYRQNPQERPGPDYDWSKAKPEEHLLMMLTMRASDGSPAFPATMRVLQHGRTDAMAEAGVGTWGNILYPKYSASQIQAMMALESATVQTYDSWVGKVWHDLKEGRKQVQRGVPGVRARMENVQRINRFYAELGADPGRRERVLGELYMDIRAMEAQRLAIEDELAREDSPEAQRRLKHLVFDLAQKKKQAYGLSEWYEREGTMSPRELGMFHIPDFDPAPRPIDGTWQMFWRDFITNVPQLGTSLGATAVGGPGAGVAFMSGRIFGDQYLRLGLEGTLEQHAFAAAIINAAAQGFLEKFSLGTFSKMIRTSGAPLKALAKSALQFTVENAAQEFLQEWPEALTEIYARQSRRGGTVEEIVARTIDEAWDNIGEITKDAGWAALLGATLGLSAGSLTVAGITANAYQQRRLLHTHQAIMSATDQAIQSGLPRSAIREVVEHARQHGQIDRISIPAKEIERTIGSDPEALQTAHQIWLPPDAYRAALEADADVEVKYSEYVEYISKRMDVDQALIKHIRWGDDVPSIAETEAANNALMAEIEEIKKTLSREETKKPAKIKELQEQLEQMPGQTSDAARQEVAVFWALAKRAAEMGGETTDQWLSRVDPTVRYVDGRAVLDAKGYLVVTPTRAVMTDPAPRSASGFVQKAVEGMRAREAPEAVVPAPPAAPVPGAVQPPGVPPAGPPAATQDAGAEVRGSLEYTKEGKAIINLFRGADLSTFLHESVHLFLDQFIGYVNSLESGKDAQAQADMAALRQFAGVKKGKWTKAAKEKVARAFEQFLHEGKAPSPKLRTAFETIKAWMLGIYGAVSQVVTGEDLSPDVRRALAHMMASEAEVQAAEVMYQTQADIANLITEDETERTKIREELASKRRTAHEQSVTRRLADLLKASVQAMGGRRGIAAKAAAEVDKVSSYRAIKSVLGEGGVSTDWLAQEFGNLAKDIAQELQKHGRSIVRKGGLGEVELSVLAQEVGYADARTMVEEMAKAAKRHVYIKSAVEETISKVEAALKMGVENQEAFPGEQAYYSEARNQVLVAELEILRRKARSRSKVKGPTEFRMMMDHATRVMASLPVRVARRYKTFAAAERRHAAQAYKALEQGDLDRAVRHKRLQLYNHAMVLASFRAVQESKAAVAKIKAKAANKGKKTQSEHQDQILALARRFGIPVGSQTPVNPNPPALRNFLEERTGGGLLPDIHAIPNWLQDGEKSVAWRDLNLEELRQLQGAVSYLASLGQAELRALKSDRKMTADEYAAEAIKPLADAPGLTPPERSGWIASMQKGVRAFTASLTALQWIFREMDNVFTRKPGHRAGPNEAMFNQGVMDAREAASNTYRRIDKQKQDMFMGLRNIIDDLKKSLGVKFDLPLLTKPEGLAVHFKDASKWTAEDVLAAALQLGNVGNASALAAGFSKDGSIPGLRSLTPLLTLEQWNQVQGVWNFIGQFKEQLGEVYKNLTGNELRWVEATSLETLLGGPAYSSDGHRLSHIQGGYYPLRRDFRLKTDRKGKALPQDQVDKMLEHDVWRSVFQGVMPDSYFTTDRVDSQIPVLLSMSTLTQHIDKVIHYIHFAPILHDINRITTNPDWVRTAQQKLGVELAAQVPVLLRQIAHPYSAMSAAQVSPILKQSARAITAAKLFWRIPTAIIQTLSSLNAGFEMGFGNLVSGMAETIISPLDSYRFASEHSHIVRDRAQNWDREGARWARRLDPMGKGALKWGNRLVGYEEVLSVGFAPIRAVDMATVTAVWMGAYKGEFAQTHDHATAVRYANDVVGTTQPMASATHLASFYGTPTHLRYFFGLFMTFMQQHGGRYLTAARVHRTGGITTGQRAMYMIIEGMVPFILANMLRDFLYRGKLPHERDPREYLYDAISGHVAWAPVVRDIYQASTRDWDAGTTGAGFELASKLKDVFRKTRQALESATGKESRKQPFSKYMLAAIEALAEMGEVGTGVPAYTILKNMYEGGAKLVRGETKNPLRLLVEERKS